MRAGPQLEGDVQEGLRPSSGDSRRLHRILTATASGTPDWAALEEALMPMLRQHFRPEFLNRIDEIILFRGLDAGQLREITRLMLEDTRRRLATQDVTVEFSDAAIELLARQGFQPEFGARPRRRTIQRQLDNRLSSMLLAGTLLNRRGDAADLSLGVPARSRAPNGGAAAEQVGSGIRQAPADEFWCRPWSYRTAPPVSDRTKGRLACLTPI